MANESIPYLCGGTFLAQVLRARLPLTTAADHINSKKECLLEQEVFRRLISIYQLKDFCAYAGDTLKRYTSDFKSCKETCEAFASFSDNDIKRAFDEDVHKFDSAALAMMSEFIRDCIDSEKHIQLVRCLLDMIQNDAENLNEALFFVHGISEPVMGKALCAMDFFTIEPFLLSVWHFIIMHRSDSNKKGATTYRQWYPSIRNYAGTIGNGITRTIHVDSIPVEYVKSSKISDLDNDTPAIDTADVDENDMEEDVVGTPEDDIENSRTVSQTIEHATIVNQYGGKNIHIDHVDTLNL